MERREFLAISTAPIAAGFPTAGNDAPPPAPDSQIIDIATTLKIEADPDGRYSFQLKRDFGLIEEDEFADADGFQRQQAESFRLIRKLLANFERQPTAAPPKVASRKLDDEIIDHAKRLTITIYRDEHLSGDFSLGYRFSEVDLDRADVLRLIRGLLAAFARKPVVYQANSADKVFSV